MAGVSVDVAVDSTRYRSADCSSRHAEGQHVGAVIDSTAEGNPSGRRELVDAEEQWFVVTVAEDSIATGTRNDSRVIKLIHHPILKVVGVLVNTTQKMACFVGDDHRQKFSKQICSRNVSGDGNQRRIHRVGDQDIDHHQAALFATEVPHVDRLSNPKKACCWVETDFRLRTADEHSRDVRLSPKIRRVEARNKPYVELTRVACCSVEPVVRASRKRCAQLLLHSIHRVASDGGRIGCCQTQLGHVARQRWDTQGSGRNTQARQVQGIPSGERAIKIDVQRLLGSNRFGFKRRAMDSQVQNVRTNTVGNSHVITTARRDHIRQGRKTVSVQWRGRRVNGPAKETALSQKKLLGVGVQ